MPNMIQTRTFKDKVNDMKRYAWTACFVIFRMDLDHILLNLLNQVFNPKPF